LTMESSLFRRKVGLDPFRVLICVFLKRASLCDRGAK